MKSPFIDEQHAARWLARFALPFVKADTAKQLRETAFSAYAQNVPNLWRGDKTDLQTPEVDYDRYDIYKKVEDQELADLQGLVKAMLHIVLSGSRHESLPQEIKRQVPAIEREIKKVTRSPEYSVDWKGSGRAAVIPIAADKEQVVARLKEWIILGITNCLYSFSLADEVKTMKGYGFEKLGLCPNCGIYFEKKRKDQEYCSVKCKGTMLKRIKRQSVRVL